MGEKKESAGAAPEPNSALGPNSSHSIEKSRQENGAVATNTAVLKFVILAV